MGKVEADPASSTLEVSMKPLRIKRQPVVQYYVAIEQPSNSDDSVSWTANTFLAIRPIPGIVKVLNTIHYVEHVGSLILLDEYVKRSSLLKVPSRLGL